MKVVIAFPEGRAGGRNYGEEETRGREGGRDVRLIEEAVAEDGAPYSILGFLLVVYLGNLEGGIRTCQT